MTRGSRSGDGSQEKRCAKCGRGYAMDYRVCPHDGTPLTVDLAPIAEEDPMIGELIADSFCIVGVVGEGGMASVYEAEHARLPKRYAVKVLSRELARNPEAIGRFEREAQAAARIVHPHVLDVVDVVRADDGRPCLITELLAGEDASLLLERVKKLAVLPAIDLCRQACRGVAAAHQNGIVHRDLKPANFFLQKRDDGGLFVKILDFGVAKMTDGANLTRVGTVVGTPAYMAPEQARGLPDVDARADVYAIGAVLYHLVTGAPPFDDPDPAKILLRVVTEEPRPIRAYDPALPVALEVLLGRAMAKNPAARIGSAVELERQLGELARALEAPAAPEPARSLTIPEPIALPARATVIDAPAAHGPAQSQSQGGLIAMISGALLVGGVGATVLSGVALYVALAAVASALIAGLVARFAGKGR